MKEGKTLSSSKNKKRIESNPRGAGTPPPPPRRPLAGGRISWRTRGSRTVVRVSHATGRVTQSIQARWLQLFAKFATHRRDSRASQLPYVPPSVRHASARRRVRHSDGSGTARACRCQHDHHL